MKPSNKIFALASLGLIATQGYAENYDNNPDWNTIAPTTLAPEVKVLDDSNSIVVNGIRMPSDNIDPRVDLSGSTNDTGISTRRAGGTDADFGSVGWFDGGVESVGRNGVMGAASVAYGYGVVGISRYVNGYGVVGVHTVTNATDTGTGVWGRSNSSAGIGITGENIGGGLAGTFKGGDVTQTLPDNGIVKGWAKIASDGSIVSCYQCNTDNNLTGKTATGSYQVSFSPLGADISARPRTATLDTHGSGVILGEIGLATLATSPNTIFIRTANSTGTNTDKSFTVIVY